MGQQGVYTHTFPYQKNPDCMVCGGAKLTLSRPRSRSQSYEVVTKGLPPWKSCSNIWATIRATWILIRTVILDTFSSSSLESGGIHVET